MDDEKNQNSPLKDELGIAEGSFEAKLPWELFIENAVSSHACSLFAYATFLMYDEHLVSEVVETIFLKLCKAKPSKVMPNVKVWLFKECRKEILDLQKSGCDLRPFCQVAMRRVAGVSFARHSTEYQKERYTHVISQLNQLSSPQKELLVLKLQQEYSNVEIEQITGLKSGVIVFLLHKALREIKPITSLEIFSENQPFA